MSGAIAVARAVRAHICRQMTRMGVYSPSCSAGGVAKPRMGWEIVRRKTHLQVAVDVPEYINRRLQQHGPWLRLEYRGHPLAHLRGTAVRVGNRF